MTPYDTIANPTIVERLLGRLSLRGIEAEVVDSASHALERVRALIPGGATVNYGLSTTLEQIGFVDVLKQGTHAWENVKAGVVAERDPIKQQDLRKRGTLADYFLGSVQAVTEDGQVIVASGTGSQIPSYVYTSSHVIWIVGTHKIVPTVSDGLKRIQDYVLPLEDRRMKSLGMAGTTIGKIAIIEREISPLRKMRMILVNEPLGF